MSTPSPASGKQPLLERLAHVIVRRRRAVIGLWVVLTLFGAFSAGQVSKRWFESFSIPGYSSYEANQRTLKAFGTGEQAPLVAVFRSGGDVTKAAGIGNVGRSIVIASIVPRKREDPGNEKTPVGGAHRGQEEQ